MGQLPHHGGRKGAPKGTRPPEHTHAWINATELRAQPHSDVLMLTCRRRAGTGGGQKGCWDPHLRGLPAGAGPLSVAAEGKDLGREVQTVRRSTGGAHRIAPLYLSCCPPRGMGCLSQGVMTTQEGDPGAPESVLWMGQGLCVCPQEHILTSGQQACPEKDSQPKACAPMVHTEHKPGSLMPHHASSVSCPTCCSLNQGSNRRRERRFCFVARDSGFTRRKIRPSMPRDVSTGEAVPTLGVTPPCTDYIASCPWGQAATEAHKLVRVFHTHRVLELLCFLVPSGRCKVFRNSERGTCSGILEDTMFRNSGRG